MAISQATLADFSHLIEALQSACVKCQPEIPGLASAKAASGAANTATAGDDVLSITQSGNVDVPVHSVSASPIAIVTAENEGVEAVNLAVSDRLNAAIEDDLLLASCEMCGDGIESPHNRYQGAQRVFELMAGNFMRDGYDEQFPQHFNDLDAMLGKIAVGVPHVPSDCQFNSGTIPMIQPYKLAFSLSLLLIPMFTTQAQDTPVCPDNASYIERWEADLDERGQMTSSAWNVSGLAVSPDGSALAVATSDALLIYDSETLQLEHTLESGMNWSNFGTISLDWSPDGDELAVARFHFTTNEEPDPRSGIYIWDVQTGQISRVLPSEPLAMSWSSANGLIAFADRHGIYSLWDPGQGPSASLESEITDQIGQIDVLSWSPDGTRLGGGRYPRSSVVIWQFDPLEEPRIFSLDSGTGEQLAWSPDGQYLAIGDWPPGPSIWIVLAETEEVVREFKGSEGIHFDVGWSPNGNLLARGTNTGLYLWDIATDSSAPIRVFTENMPPFVRMVWLTDSQHLISVDFEGSIYRWDIETGCVEAAVLNEWTWTPG